MLTIQSIRAAIAIGVLFTIITLASLTAAVAIIEPVVSIFTTLAVFWVMWRYYYFPVGTPDAQQLQDAYVRRVARA
ncbi:MAG: hypothetical protein A3F70_03090 [Acidobacteria bacterium RIFCSPLOWO2_12_FULL_67_14]|nr:MAG: hypothetical protein A3H29_18125 [Acidobacteria bacterium RIFCSPLOWO2_02_FULL_67_21]OFW37908.1 MAG: hypothetical protein A3F70_03090 [Acidobacteria bacterium RIFCSPLOWO2_12_FULL_67_14]